MISKEHAVEAVDELLGEMSAEDRPHDPYVIITVEEHRFGWIINWNCAGYAQTRDMRDMLVGGGPLLVDAEDGSVHMIHAAGAYVMDSSGCWTWEDIYDEWRRGVPDIPLQKLIIAAERFPAVKELRRRVPAMTLPQAIAYVDAVQAGSAPLAELMSMTDPDWPRRLPFTTLRKPPRTA